MQDIVERLRGSTHQIDHDAADEIERLRRELEMMTEALRIASTAVESLHLECDRHRRAANEHRNAAMEADLRTQAAVRGEKAARADRVNISELRRIMTEWHQQAKALGFDGVPDLIAGCAAEHAKQ